MSNSVFGLPPESPPSLLTLNIMQIEPTCVMPTNTTCQSPVNYELIQELCPGYLHAYLAGGKSEGERLDRYAIRILETCRRLNKKRLVIERQPRSTASDEDLFVLLNHLLVNDLDNMQIAYIDNEPENSPGMRFAVREAAKQGRNIRSFRDEPTAVSWLS